ncbi:MAG: DUF5667 domain-containing protein [Candidatus Limnocylindrales bacterium]
MVDLMADDGMLRRRLDAFAEARLTPDLAAATRMRARVLAVAHRRSALGLADPGLALLPTPDVEPRDTVTVRTATRVASPRRRAARRRVLTLFLAVTLTLGTAAGTALAGRPGGAFYGARLWVETLTLPADPEARAIAELERLRDRLAEADAAATAGDTDAATAALRAYESIVAEATAHAVAAGNGVAGAALEEGVAQQVAVLRQLATTLPDSAAPAIAKALEHAIEQSSDAIDTIGDSPAGGSDGNGGNGKPDGNGGSGGGDPTTTPTARPTAAPGTTPGATPTVKPTKEPKPTPEPTAVPAATDRPAGWPTPEPGATPRPTPRGQGG